MNDINLCFSTYLPTYLREAEHNTWHYKNVDVTISPLSLSLSLSLSLTHTHTHPPIYYTLAFNLSLFYILSFTLSFSLSIGTLYPSYTLTMYLPLSSINLYLNLVLKHILTLYLYSHIHYLSVCVCLLFSFLYLIKNVSLLFFLTSFIVPLAAFCPGNNTVIVFWSN